MERRWVEEEGAREKASNFYLRAASSSPSSLPLVDGISRAASNGAFKPTHVVDVQRDARRSSRT